MKAERKPISAGKQLRFHLEVAGLRALEWLVTRFSRRAVTRAGRAVGSLAYYLAPDLRRIALANLDIAFGDTKSSAEKRRIARASLQNFGRTLFGLFWSSRLTRENFEQFVTLDQPSLEMALAVQARGTGMVVFTPHYGDWELLGQACGWYGILMTIVQEAEQNVAVEEILGRLRGVSGHRLVPGKSAAYGLLKALKRGGTSGMLVDVNATRRQGGDWLEFFGLPVYSPTAAGGLTRHTGAAIMPCVATPLPDGRIQIVYGPEITWQRTGDADADIRAINQQCLAFCERTIRAAPEFWFWSYKRWKLRPTPDQGRYPAYSRFNPRVAPE